MRFKPKLTAKWSVKHEEELIKIWKEEKVYAFNRNSKKPFFSIDTPPPYASGAWHIGAAAHYTQIDMIARTMRFKGYEVYFPFGVDRNGLPVEVQAEKHYKIKMHECSREEFINLCKKFLDNVEKELLKLAERLGFSCDLENYFQTDMPKWRAITQATFIWAFKKGLVYESDRPTNYCPGCKTTLADAEVEYKEKPTKLVYMKFKVAETGEEIVIASTRPELLASCAAVLYNPKDERYTHLEGLHAIVPLYSHEVPILSLIHI